ncbi:MAG: zinc metalloprotease HtpX [Candidatus Methanofastidiosia archaeon]
MKTVILMGTLTGLLLFTGWVLGVTFGYDPTGTITIAFLIAMAINLVSYWYSDKIVLKMYKAKIVSENEYPKLHAMVSNLAFNANLPKPNIAIIPTETPNAFATGRNEENAVVAVTKGAFNLLSRDELEGVLGHELAHIKNRDMFISTFAAVMAGTIGYIGFMGRWMLWTRGSRRESGSLQLIGFLLLVIFIPLAATMIRLAVSRAREYDADYRGAKISGKPDALARALLRLESYSLKKPLKMGNPATANLFIVNPFKGESLLSLLSTHPSTKDRVRKLNELAKRMGRPMI